MNELEQLLKLTKENNILTKENNIMLKQIMAYIRYHENNDDAKDFVMNYMANILSNRV